VFGEYKIKSTSFDSIQNIDVSEIFVTGKENPYHKLDYLAYYDYYLIEAKVVGTKQVYDKSKFNPLMLVTKWTRVNFLTYSILIILLSTSSILTIQLFIDLKLLKKNSSKKRFGVMSAY
nr:hypothetical protein [Chitinophagaceae bacterium]